MTREYFYISLLFIIFLFIYTINQYKLIQREAARVSTYVLHISTPLDPHITEVLDNMCTECLNDYIVLSAELFNIEYINDDLEKKIQHDILEMVTERISPAFIDKLSIYYNPKNINDLIARKVVITVTGYVVNVNNIREKR